MLCYRARTLLACVMVPGIAWGEPADVRVGPQQDGRIVVPTNQVLSPAGRQVLVAGRPTDLALSPDGRHLAVVIGSEIRLLDPASGATISTAKIAGASYKGVVFNFDGSELYVSTTPSSRKSKERSAVSYFSVAANGELKRQGNIEFGAPNEQDRPESRPLAADATYSYGSKHLPAGIAWSADGDTLLVALNLANQLAAIDRRTHRVVKRIAVGNAPYDVAVVGAKAYVTNFAGRRPDADSVTGPAGVGADVRVDPRRHIASEGSVSVVDWQRGQVLKEIVVGPHASAIAASPVGRHVAVACANDDQVWMIDTSTDELAEKILVRPAQGLLFGSVPGALAFSRDGRRLFVACGTNNAIAVIEFAPGRSALLGFVPVGWYPGAVLLDQRRQQLIVANVKGIGSREQQSWQGKRVEANKRVFGFNSHDYLGSLSLVPLPSDSALAAHTATVLTSIRATETISARRRRAAGRAPRPVPERHGEPSVFQHVVYLIKENRTYDQVLGDIERGEGDANLCIFGREVTPNHHQLVDEFVLLDNFYCSGVLSADGHQWAMEAYVTDYIEKAFGGFPRSYPFAGGDALAYAPSGFIWDNALEHHKTLRVYGEFVKASVGWKDASRKGKPNFLDCYHDFLAEAGEVQIRGSATIKTLEPYVCPTYVGFPATVPDVYRVREFIRELHESERRGEMPNLSIVLLPNDHTSGTRPLMPTPAAAVADNDLALGRIVEALSRSRFWRDTCLFVVQDDPQDGFDHIDGHRTVAMVISPYTRRGVVDSTNFNQTSMVRTIELILGLPPMNQLDASAVPMSSCFTEKPDFTAYRALPNRVPLDQLNPKLAAIGNPRQLHWARQSLAQELDEVDEADEDVLNRILWFAVRGRDDTYPAWAVVAEADEDD